MKRFMVFALAMSLAMLIALPAMAIQADFSGSYRVRGWYMDQSRLDDDTGSPNAFMDMRLRLKTTFKVSDRLFVTTRIDAPGYDDKAAGGDVWGSVEPTGNNTALTPHNEGINFDRAYLTAVFDFGTFIIGRETFGRWGTRAFNIGDDFDVLKFYKRIGNLHILPCLLKWVEADQGTADADKDIDTPFLAAWYTPEGLDAGIVTVFVQNRLNDSFKSDWYWIVPYFKYTRGPLYIEGEWDCRRGDYADFYDPTQKDIKYDGNGYYLYASYTAGPATIGVGWLYTQGDDNDTDDEMNAIPRGHDYQPLLILTGQSNDRNLGGLGNLNRYNSSNQVLDFDNDGTLDDEFYRLGSNIIFIDGKFSVTDNIVLNGVVGWATSDVHGKTNGRTWDDEYGVEADIGCTVKLMDNLTYTATVGYLWAGDLWKQGGTQDVDDTFTVVHCLQVNF
nr:hypothetical protein [Desulfobacterales bacterium]